ncbi:hypothetical protein [Siphonobacter sp. SORGH_AS_1065]|uniref:hypothetical protein n=1 Tax=Siphonobacter sp. SORGH_AS_1065 TaxID=3041795 RepID=UPI00277EC05F|nr:hypothetical protein [Siphonobacter sp. SORGH_AS_1065]MDQ1087186.1 hypothetical protein [Siphonobacter sp. SORGH_AS_1065]
MNTHLMYLEFKEIKTLQDLVMIMTEVQTELREIKVILSGQVDRHHLTVSDIAKEMGYSDFAIKGWINKGRKHPFFPGSN